MATETATQPRRVPMWRFPGVRSAVMGMIQATMGYWGYLYGWTVTARLLREELGYTSTDLGVAGTVGRALSIGSNPVGGWVGDRWWGGRWGSLGFFVATGLALLGLSTIGPGALLILLAYYAVINGAAVAGSYRISWPVTNRWWIDRRVFWIGLIILGGGSSGVWGPVFTAWLNQVQGWRGMLVTTGIMTIVIAGTAAFFYPSGRPEDHGLYPDNVSEEEKRQRAEAAAARRGRQAVVRPALVDFTTAMALRSRAFWLVTIAGVTAAFASTPLTIFQNIRMGDLGYTAMEAAAFFTLRLTFSYVGRVGIMVTGDWLSAKLSPRFIVMMGYLMETVGMTFFALGTATWYFYAWALLDGVGLGIIVPGLAALMGSYFGRSSFGFIYGLRTGLAAIGAAIAPTLVGWLSDVRKGDWLVPFLIIVGGYGLSAVIFVFCTPPKEQTREAVR